MKIEKPSPSPLKPSPTAAPTPSAPTSSAPASAPQETSASSFEARTSKTAKRPPPTTPRAPAPPAGSASTPSGASEPPKGIADVLRNLMSGQKPPLSAALPPPASTPSATVPHDDDRRAICLAPPSSGKSLGLATSDPAVLRDLQQRGAELLLDDEAFAGKMLDRFPDDRSYMAFQNNVIHAIEERIAKELAGRIFPDQDAANEAALDVAAQVKREARSNPDAFLP